MPPSARSRAGSIARSLRDPPVFTPAAQRLGLSARLIVAAAVFIFVLWNAVWLLDHAFRHVETVKVWNNGYFRGEPPTYRDAALGIVLGPCLQVVVFGGGLLAARRRGRHGQQALACVSWWILGFDALFVSLVAAYAMSGVI